MAIRGSACVLLGLLLLVHAGNLEPASESNFTAKIRTACRMRLTRKPASRRPISVHRDYHALRRWLDRHRYRCPVPLLRAPRKKAIRYGVTVVKMHSRSTDRQVGRKENASWVPTADIKEEAWQSPHLSKVGHITRWARAPSISTRANKDTLSGSTARTSPSIRPNHLIRLHFADE